jgi:hypothetical protein
LKQRAPFMHAAEHHPEPHCYCQGKWVSRPATQQHPSTEPLQASLPSLCTIKHSQYSDKGRTCRACG